MTPAYVRAANCFAVARSTTFAAEREAAIGRGIAIAVGAGLDLHLFDIPGRENAQSTNFDDLHRCFDAGAMSRDELREALRRMGVALETAEVAAGARDGESAYDARRRNFGEACAAAKARDAQRQGNAA